MVVTESLSQRFHGPRPTGTPYMVVQMKHELPRAGHRWPTVGGALRLGARLCMLPRVCLTEATSCAIAASLRNRPRRSATSGTTH